MGRRRSWRVAGDCKSSLYGELVRIHPCPPYCNPRMAVLTTNQHDRKSLPCWQRVQLGSLINGALCFLYAPVPDWEWGGLQNRYESGVGSIPTRCSNQGMSMAKSNRHAGQFDLRGKKTLRLRCKCCEVQDFRDKLETARVRKELNAAREVSAISLLS